MLRMSFDEATKARLKTVGRSKLNLRCAKHRRYNPAEGRAAIRGCCPGCLEALEAYEARVGFAQALAKYISLTAKFETMKPRQRKPTPVLAGVSDQTQGWINVIKGGRG